MKPRPYYRCNLVSVSDLLAGELTMTMETNKDGDRFTVTLNESQAIFVQARLASVLTPK